jgi:hypothetical protein
MLVKNYYFQIILLFSILITFSCNKDDSISNNSPTVVIRVPQENANLNESDTVFIEVSITSKSQIHDYTIQVLNTTENTEAMMYYGHSDNKTTTNSLYFMPNVNADSKMQLIVKTLNHNGIIYTKSLFFNVANNVLDNKPKIEILSPTAGFANNGETIRFKASITHSQFLKNLIVKLMQDNEIKFLSSQDVIGLKSYLFDSLMTVNVTSASDFTFLVSATDSNDVSETKTFNFHVHP